MNKAKKILAVLMALCMAFGVLSVSAFAGSGSLQAAINAAAADATISWSGTSGPVTISRNLTINFGAGAKVWSSEAKPAITIANGAKVTLDGVTAGVTSYDDFSKYDVEDLYDAYLAASVPAIRVGNNAQLTLKNAVVTGGEAEVVSTGIDVPVGAGVETYNNAVVNVENSIVYGSWGVENTSSSVVNIAATSIVAGYMDATAALYRTNIAAGSYKLTSKELVDAFMSADYKLDAEQADMADQLFGDRVYLVVEAAPTAVNGLDSECYEGVATISFDAGDTLWVPEAFTLGEFGTETPALSGDKYTVTFTGVETGAYPYTVDYKLRADLGDIAGSLNDFVADFARDYWPDLCDNFNSAIDDLLLGAHDQIEVKLTDAYRDLHKLLVEANSNTQSPLRAVRPDLIQINKYLYNILGTEVYCAATGADIEDFDDDEIVTGVYFEVLNYFKALKAESTFVDKALYIKNNYQALWNKVAGTEGDTLYANVKAVYDVLNSGSTLADLINIIDTNPTVAAMVDPDLTQQIEDIKAQLTDILDAFDGEDGARDIYNDVVASAEFNDFMDYMSEANLRKGAEMFDDILNIYAPDFDGTKLLVKEADLNGSIDIINIVEEEPVIDYTAIQTEVSIAQTGYVTSSTQAAPITETTTIYSNAPFTLTAVGDEDVFCFWTNAETGKIWSYDEQITISPTNNKKLVAVFSPDEEEDCCLFVDQSNKYVHSGNGVEDAPAVPETLFNGTMAFTGWKKIASKGEFIEIYQAQYELTGVNDLAFNVSVAAGGVLWNNEAGEAYEETSLPYLFKDIVYVVANDEDNFSYWKDQDGNKLSYSKEYSFVATRDVELTAVFEGAQDEDYALNTFFTLDGDDTLNIFSERAIKADAGIKVIEVGTLLCVKSSVADEDIVLGTAGVTRAVDKVTSANYPANGTYWTFVSAANVATMRSRGITARARGYIVFEQNGRTYTDYADVASFSEF